MRNTDFQPGYRIIYGEGTSYARAWENLEKHMNVVMEQFDVEFLPGSSDKDDFKKDIFIASQRVLLKPKQPTAAPVPEETATMLSKGKKNKEPSCTP